MVAAMPVVSIRHLTTYRYRNPVAFGEHRMMFRPLESFDQRLLSAELTVSPEPSLLRHVHDVSGAEVAVARFDLRSDTLRFESKVELAHEAQAPFDLEGEDSVLGAAAFDYDVGEAPALACSRALIDPDAADEVRAWARRFVRPVGRTRLSALLSEMTHAIRSEFTYGKRLEGKPQAPAQTLELRRGSCRDFAVLMIEAARSLGLAARFVSGYVYSPRGGSATRGGGHTHAWVRVYFPDCGWVDFDPTNGLVGAANLIRVVVAADPRQAIPLHGSWAGLPFDYLGMDVEVDVTPQTALAAQPAGRLRVAHQG